MDQKCTGSILLVGEGDFSLSASLINIMHHEDLNKITSSSFETNESIHKHTDAKQNINYLKQNGIEVKLGIDATQLHLNRDFQKRQFERIIFNFPHVGGKTNLKKNRKLLDDFFASASLVLEEGGQILVTLCKGQGGTPADKPMRAWHDSWQIVSMAANSGLILRECIPFASEKFSKYKSTGFRSQDKGFHTEGAITHVFTKTDSVVCSESKINYLSEKLQRQLHMEITSPICKMKNILEKLFTELCKTEFSQEILIKSIESCSLKSDTVNRLSALIKDPPTYCYLNLDKTEFKITDTSKLQNDPASIQHLCVTVLEHLFLQPLGTLTAHLITCMVASPVAMTSHSQLPVGFEMMLVVPVINPMCQMEDVLSKIVDAFNSCIIQNTKREIVLKIEEKQTDSLEDSEMSLVAALNLNLFEQNLGTVASFFFYKTIKCLIIKVDLCELVCKLYDIPNKRLFWSTDKQVHSELTKCMSDHSIFKPVSVYPMKFQHDMSFWESMSYPFDEYIFSDIIRNIAGDSVIGIQLLEIYMDSEKGLKSRCYRLFFQSCDKALSYKASWEIQSKIRLEVAKIMSIMLR